MQASNSLTSGLDAFAAQFRAQAESAGLPASEHAIHFCLALGLQAAWTLPPGAIVFERPARSGTRIDLWVRDPYDLAIEVKYLRSHPSGSQPARPIHYGQLRPTSTRPPKRPAGSGSSCSSQMTDTSSTSSDQAGRFSPSRPGIQHRSHRRRSTGSLTRHGRKPIHTAPGAISKPHFSGPVKQQAAPCSPGR